MQDPTPLIKTDELKFSFDSEDDTGIELGPRNIYMHIQDAIPFAPYPSLHSFLKEKMQLLHSFSDHNDSVKSMHNINPNLIGLLMLFLLIVAAFPLLRKHPINKRIDFYQVHQANQRNSLENLKGSNLIQRWRAIDEEIAVYYPSNDIGISSLHFFLLPLYNDNNTY